MRKTLLIIGGIFVFLLIIVVCLPFMIDFNKYRYEIKEAVEKNIEAEFQVESLGLKGLGVEIKNLSLKSKGNFQNKEILSVGEARVKISLLSLLTFHPKATVLLKKPKITIVRNIDGTLNFASLMKRTEEEHKTQTTSGKSSDKSLKKGGGVLFLLGSSLSFRAEEAMLRYVDEKTQSTSAVENLNIFLEHPAIQNRPIHFSISAFLAMGGSETTPLIEGKFSSTGDVKMLFKPSQVISGVELSSTFSFGELTAEVQGKISDFETLESDIKIKTPSLSVAKLKDIFSPLKRYSLDGLFHLNGSLKGRLKDFDQCQVNANVKLHLKTRETDLIFKSTLTETLSKLKSEFIIESSILNLDEFLPQTKKAHSNVYSEILADLFNGIPRAMASSQKGKELLLNLQENPVFAGLTAHGNIDIKKIILRKAEMTHLQGQCNLNNLVFSVSRLGLQAFDGKLSAKGSFALSSPQPIYQLTMVLQNLKMNSLLKMASPSLKEAFTGTLNATMDVAGRGSSFEEVKKYLTGKGRIEIKDGELQGLNMGKTLQEELKLISIFAGSDIFNEDLTGRFDSLTSTLIIKEGKLQTPDATLKAPGYGAELKGYTSFEKEINYEGKVLLPAKKFKSQVLASLADSKGMIGFPFMLRGVLPKFAFTVDPAQIVQMAARATLSGGVREEIKKKTGIDLPIDLPF